MDPSLDSLVRDAMERYRVPGVAIGMLRADELDVAAFGVTSVEHPLPVDGDTLFQIASVTKTMTATVIMRLIERGALDLDAPVRRYIPAFRLRDAAAQERATVRHLVTHTGGWLGDCFADFGNGDDALERYVAAMAELEQITPLGEIWHYSNSSFALLGRLIEVVTGKTYEAATRELLFVPLGMTRSCFSAGEAITHRVAVGHVIVDEKPTVARPWAFPRAATPVGGIVSTANDLMRYARFHLGDGRAPDGARLLSRESLDLMRTPLADADLDRKVGVSWFIRSVGGVRLQYHGGVAIGQQGVLMLAPDRGEAITVQTNSARGGLLHQDVTTWWQRQRLKLNVPEPVYIELETARYKEYADRYRAELSDAELELSDTGLVYRTFSHNKLNVQPKPPDPPPSRVAFTSDARFTLLDGPLKDTRGEFLRGPDGMVRYLRVGGRVYRRKGS
ncbi:MAG: beta-lactamase family protein [Chloroflexi bacterium]|nr:MAG: beta-lactamase family protein [Chloroflexota bacterium]TMF58825.1 MAG: beta-lactamase family protein [Chloroflexota bacterium]